MKICKINNVLEGLAPLQTVELSLMTVALAALPIALSVSVFAVYAAVAVGVVGMVVNRRSLRTAVSGKPRLVRWGLGLMMAFWALYAVSLMWTTNIPEGFLRLYKALPLLILGFYFLVADPTVYTWRRIRAVLWTQAAVLLVLFVVRLSVMLWRAVFDGVGYSGLTGDHFYSLHHAYMAYFLLMSIGFLYSEAVRLWGGINLWRRVAFVAAIVALAAFVVFVNSRAGVLGLAMTAVLCVAHLAFVRRNWRAALVVAAVLAVSSGSVYMMLPSSAQRLSNTVIDPEENQKPDARVTIYSIALKAVADQPFGYGVGDYMDVLGEYYAANDYEHGKKERQNSHNQYIDTTLAIGFIGLALLLSLLACFFIVVWRRRDVAAVIFLLVTAESIMFEAMFYRQWGLLLFCIAYGLFAICPDEKNNAI